MKKNEIKTYIKSLDLMVVKKKDVEDKISIENKQFSCGTIEYYKPGCSTINSDLAKKDNLLIEKC